MYTKIIRSTMRSYLFAFGVVGLLTASAASKAKASELATATFTTTQIAPGENHYSLTLNNVGTTTIGSLWFAWVPGDNFMPTSPTGVASPAGWVEAITQGGPSNGFAIQWKATGSVNDLNAGGSLSGFDFNSSLTPADLEAPASGTPSVPVLTSFVYSGAPFSDAGVQITPAAAPEPAEFGSGAMGLLMLSAVARRKKASSK